MALLAQAQTEPERLVATPNTLLDSQAALKKLKEGLIEAQLTAAQLQGRMSDTHPLVLAAKESQAEIRNRLHDELANAIRALEVDLRLGAEKTATLDEQLASLVARLDVLAALRAPYANQLAQTRKCSELLDRAQQRLADARATHATAGATNLISPIDGPDAGTRPIGPSQAMIVLLGMAGGLLAGFGVVLLTVDPTAGSGGRQAPAVLERRDANTTERPDAGAAQRRDASAGQGHSTVRRRSAFAAQRPSVDEALKALVAVGGRRRTDF